MGLSAFDFASSFLGGVQERAQEYDDALAKRIQELADKGPSDITKSKYKADYDEYLDDKKKLIAITSAGIDSDRGQMLAGGYNSMQDYLDARTSAKLAGEDLYHEMFTLGDEPKYTPADYGITNIRDDGSTVTTAGQMFDQFFRPDVHKARSAELIPTPTKEGSTAYFRRDNTRTTEDIQKSREAVRARAVALQSAGEHDKLPEEMEVKSLDKDNNSITQTYVKIPNPSDEYLISEAGLAAEKVVGLPGYQKVGVPVFTENSEFAQSLRNLGPKPTDGDKEVLADWIYKYNTLVYGATMADTIERDGRPKLNTIITGLYNENDREVSIRYTENPDDVFMKGTDFEMTGWIQIGKPKPEDTPDEITVHKLLDGVMHTYSLMKTSNTDIGTALEGYDGYRVMGEPVPTKAMTNLQEKLNEHGEEPNRSQYETDKMYESAIDIWRKGYNKILYGITSLEDSDGPAVGTIIDGVLNDKGVKVKVEYTGKSTDSFMGMEGYRLFGGDEEAAPTPSIGSTLNIYNAADQTTQQVQYVGGTEKSIVGMDGYRKVGDPVPAEESTNLQATYNSKGEKVKILYTGVKTDSFEKRVGWIQVGGAEPLPDTSLSSSDKLKQPMIVLLEAIDEGITVTEAQLEAARLVYSRSEDAMGMEYEKVLDAFGYMTLMVRDFSHLKLPAYTADGRMVGVIYNDNGKATGGTPTLLPATMKNIKAQAEILGTTERILRKGLLDEHNKKYGKN